MGRVTGDKDTSIARVQVLKGTWVKMKQSSVTPFRQQHPKAGLGPEPMGSSLANPDTCVVLSMLLRPLKVTNSWRERQLQSSHITMIGEVPPM